jgi:cyclophilin family peptidyl-prolyl cis-trans isomerase
MKRKAESKKQKAKILAATARSAQPFLLFAFCLLLLSVSTARPSPAVYRVRVDTTKGPFVIEVHRTWAPHGADRFYELVESGFYDDSRVFRVREKFIAQFGIAGNPRVTKRWEGRTIADDPVRESNVRGTIAFAMTGPHTRLTQVYINLADNWRLDNDGFAVFGRVVSGMRVVDRLYAGYGETAGGGMRGGKQAPLLEEGNAYLDREYPKLDRIVRASVLRPAS